MSGPRWSEAVTVKMADAGQLNRVQAMAENSSDGPHWPESAWEPYKRSSTEDRIQRQLLVLCSQADQEVLGWLAGSLLADQAELEFMHIREEQRGQGLGRQLLSEWIAQVTQLGAASVVLEARVRNLHAIVLYASAGFQVQGTRCSYYANPVDDAVLMGMHLV